MDDFDEKTQGSLVRKKLQLGASLQYFVDMEEVSSMLSCFAKAQNGRLGLIERHRTVDGETGFIVTKEIVKPLEKFTLEQIKKIASKIGLGRQKLKAEYIEKMNQLVGNQMTAVLNDGVQRVAQRMKQLYTTSLIVMQFIGIVFHVMYRTSYANLNDQKKRTDFESGFGPNNERFFEAVAAINNNNESTYHLNLLPLPDDQMHSFNSVKYDHYLSQLNEAEHPTYTIRRS